MTGAGTQTPIGISFPKGKMVEASTSSVPVPPMPHEQNLCRTLLGFGQQGVAPTMFQRHLGLKGSPFRPAHLGCRQTEISDLRWTERRSEFKRRVLHAHDRTSRTESGSLA